MNKSIRKVAFAAAVVAVTGYGVYENQSKETVSDVMLENVEALATGEGSSNVYCCGNYGDCMYVLDKDGNPITIKGIKLSVPCPEND